MIMTSKELIARMKELLAEPNYYGSGGSNWSSYVSSGWYVDCICSIKAILWGGRFIEDNRGKAHAGCSYKSNDVPDFTPQSCVEWIGATKGNFKTLVPGEILLMTSHGHAGLYIGNGEVIEVTPAWTGGNPGCQISKIGSNGERIKNGKQVYSWEYHGKIPVIDYSSTTEEESSGETSEATQKFNIGDKVVLNGILYYNSTEDIKGQSVSNKVTTITKYAKGAKHPYNTTGNLGWMNEKDISLYTEDESDEIAVGDMVVPIKLVDYAGNVLIKYDNSYKVLEIFSGRAILGALRSGKYVTWAALDLDNIKKV